MLKPGRHEPLAEVEAGDLGPHLQVDGLPIHHQRGEQEADAELLELDRDGVVRLGHGEGELAAREELGLLTALGHQIRLRQSAESVLLSQGMDDAGIVPLSRGEEEVAAVEREVRTGLRAGDDPREAALGDRPKRPSVLTNGFPGKRRP